MHARLPAAAHPVRQHVAVGVSVSSLHCALQFRLWLNPEEMTI